MTNQQHPITPPPELLGKWEEDWHHAKVKHIELEDHIATQAARWGADQELEACCLELVNGIGRSHAEFPSCLAEDLCIARRLKPPSLKEQALHDLEALEKDLKRNGMGFGAATIRRALEALPND